MHTQTSCPRQEANHNSSLTIRSLRTPRKRQSLNGQTDKLSKAEREPQQLCHNKVSSNTEEKAVLEWADRQAVQGRKWSTITLSQLGLFVHPGKKAVLEWADRQAVQGRKWSTTTLSQLGLLVHRGKKRKSLTPNVTRPGRESSALPHPPANIKEPNRSQQTTTLPTANRDRCQVSPYLHQQT